jgi:hypothetical protein
VPNGSEPSLYPCGCGETFDTAAELAEHHRIAHGGED